MKTYKSFLRQLLTIIVCGIAINFIGVKIALFFGWPLFLDSIGTILAAALGGYLPGIIVGFFSNAINAINDPITLYYAIISVIFAILANILSMRGVFKKLSTTLLSMLPFAVVGGCLGSIITWLLYGLNFGSGISATLAIMINQRSGMDKFWSQFAADFGIDLFDKLVVFLIIFFVLNHLPPKILLFMPHGYIYNTELSKKKSLAALATPQLTGRFSLQKKVLYLILVTAAVLSITGTYLSYSIYKETTDSRFIKRCESVVELMSEEINPDAIHVYLANKQQTPEYYKIKQKLQKIKDSFDDVRFIYVYQIREDGCHVVFDFDTPDTPAGTLGEIVPIEDSFKPYLPQLLSGQPINPIISNDSYGWLLTCYKPLYDAHGKCVAYAAADIDMRDITNEQYIFLIRLLSLFFGLTITIVAFAIWYADHNVVRPINAIAKVANNFAYDCEDDRQESTQIVRSLGIRTNDEIENLYDAMLKMVTDVTEYISQLREKAEFISKMQQNIISSFAGMVENRDETTGGHIKRTAAYVKAICEDMLSHGDYPETLTELYAENIIRSAPLHDIGKIKIPDSILNKPGKLTDEEFAIMKTHTIYGKEILQNALEGIETDNYLHEAIDMAISHHEFWNGKGYPHGLKGEDIPLSGRIMAVADVFDALVSKRSYKEPFTFDKAFTIIREETGTHFDPVVAERFLAMQEDIIKIAQDA